MCNVKASMPMKLLRFETDFNLQHQGLLSGERKADARPSRIESRQKTCCVGEISGVYLEPFGWRAF